MHCAPWGSISSRCRSRPTGSGRRSDQRASHLDRLDLEGDAVFAGLKLAEFLACVALRQTVDEFVIRVGDYADQPTADLRITIGHLRIDKKHRHLAVALKILRPRSAGVAVDPDDAALQPA